MIAVNCRAQPPGVVYSITVPYTGTGTGYSPYPYPTVLQVVTDAAGNTYIAGGVASSGLPTTPGVVQPQYAGGICNYLYDVPCANAFIAKFDPTGALLFLTYLGGTYSSSPAGLAVDSSGNIYISVAADVSYVTRLSPKGTGLGWLTFATGGGPLAMAPDGSLICLASGFPATLTKLSTSNGQSLASITVPLSQALTVAADGSVYVGGQTYSALTPTAGAWQTIFNGYSDGFVAKVAPDLSGLAWLTYVGGSGMGPQSVGYANLLEAAPDGGVWVSGSTYESDFPVLPGALQTQLTHPAPSNSPSGYLVHLSADGSKAAASTYLAAPAASVALDGSGNVVFSSTQPGFQPTPGAEWPCAGSATGFTGKVDAAGQHLLWGTGSGPSVPNGPVTVDNNGNALVAGNVPGDGNVTLTAMTTVAGPARLVDSCIGAAGFPYLPGPVAPGEIISIYGAGFGPAQGVVAQPTGNQFGTELGGVQVMVEGTPAPLLYASAAQINLVVPYMLNGHSAAHITIVTANATSNEVVLGVRQAMPEIFATAAGDAIINQDGTINDDDHPAHIGDTVSIYISGAGQTSPPGVDGAIPQAAGGAPLLPVVVQLNPGNGIVTYAGNAPGIISGVTQVNFQVPQLPIAGVPGSANSADISVMVGAATSRPASSEIPPQLWYVQ